MKLPFATLALALSVLSFPFVSANAARPAGLRLDKLVAERDFVGGCGCSVWRGRGESPETLVFSELEQRASARVKLNGKLRTLKWISSTEKSGDPRIGDRFTRVYSDGSLRLTMNYITTFVCPPRSDSCEVTRYNVNVLLEQDRERAVLKGLEGDCGC